jgi:hypothetical protein
MHTHAVDPDFDGDDLRTDVMRAVEAARQALKGLPK